MERLIVFSSVTLTLGICETLSYKMDIISLIHTVCALAHVAYYLYRGMCKENKINSMAPFFTLNPPSIKEVIVNKTGHLLNVNDVNVSQWTLQQLLTVSVKSSSTDFVSTGQWNRHLSRSLRTPEAENRKEEAECGCWNTIFKPHVERLFYIHHSIQPIIPTTCPSFLQASIMIQSFFAHFAPFILFFPSLSTVLIHTPSATLLQTTPCSTARHSIDSRGGWRALLQDNTQDINLCNIYSKISLKSKVITDRNRAKGRSSVHVGR